MDPAIVALTPERESAAHALNQRFATELSSTTAEAFAELVRVAVYARCIGDGNGIDGFLIAFDRSTVASGENLDWFRARFPDILYIDRVAVANHAQRRGIARALYGDLIAWAGLRDHLLIGCEVNVRPPNPASDAFHAGLGFAEIAQRDLRNGRRVRYLVKRLAARASDAPH